MRQVRTACPACTEKNGGKEVEVEFYTIDMRVCIIDKAGNGWYSFGCPVCTTTIFRKSSPLRTDTLLASDVERVAQMTLPDGTIVQGLHADVGVNMPLTQCDLSAFISLLSRPDDSWFEELTSQIDRTDQ